MKHLALLILCSCSLYSSNPSDPAPDAMVDSPAADAPPLPQGCRFMGSLPLSRSVIIATGDPIPAAIIMELQDRDIADNNDRLADKRVAFKRTFFPRIIAGGPNWAAPALVTAADGKTGPAITSTAADIGAAVTHIEIPHDVGDRILDLTAKICGNGVADFSMVVRYDAAYAINLGIGGGSINNATNASWQTLVPFFAIADTLITDGSLITLEVAINGAGFSLGEITATFDRP